MSLEPLDCIKSQPVFQQNTIQLKVLNERRGRVSVSNRRGDLISGNFSANFEPMSLKMAVNPRGQLVKRIPEGR